MDIVLTTRFNNPSLPVVELPGFVDSFNRPAADNLGSTDDGKPWLYSGGPWSVTEGGTALGLGGGSVAYVDSLTTEGTLTAVLAKAPSAGADPRAGIAFHVQDGLSYMYLCPNTSGALTFYVRQGGSAAMSRVFSGRSLSDGDVLSVTLSGNLVTLHHNGDELFSEPVTHLPPSTRHGLVNFHSSCDAEWETIEFTP